MTISGVSVTLFHSGTVPLTCFFKCPFVETLVSIDGLNSRTCGNMRKRFRKHQHLLFPFHNQDSYWLVISCLRNFKSFLSIWFFLQSRDEF